MAQPFIGERGGDRAAFVVGHHPGRSAGVAEQPGRAVGGKQQAPGPLDGAGEIALVGAQQWKWRSRLDEVERPVRPAIVGRRLLRYLLFGSAARTMAAHRLRPSRSSRSLKSSPALGGSAIATSGPQPAAAARQSRRHGCQRRRHRGRRG